MPDSCNPVYDYTEIFSRDFNVTLGNSDQHAVSDSHDGYFPVLEGRACGFPIYVIVFNLLVETSVWPVV